MKSDSKVKELEKELNFLYQVAKTVHSLELDEVLQEIVKITLSVTKGDSCLIYILDPKKKQLVLKASKNPHVDLLEKITMKLGEGITGWVAKEKKSVFLKEKAYKDPRFKPFSDLPEDRYEAFLSVPIINKIGIVGVINIQHRKVHTHSSMEINLLTAIGKLVGGAVENAVLLSQTLELKEALELRKLIEQAKGIIMKHKHISEDEAYRLLQKESMDTRKSLKEISDALILAEKLKI